MGLKILSIHVIPSNHRFPETVFEKIKYGDLFGVNDCRLWFPWFPEELYFYFQDFPPSYKNCEVGPDEILC